MWKRDASLGITQRERCFEISMLQVRVGVQRGPASASLAPELATCSLSGKGPKESETETQNVLALASHSGPACPVVKTFLASTWPLVLGILAAESLSPEKVCFSSPHLWQFCAFVPSDINLGL